MDDLNEGKLFYNDSLMIFIWFLNGFYIVF